MYQYGRIRTLQTCNYKRYKNKVRPELKYLICQNHDIGKRLGTENGPYSPDQMHFKLNNFEPLQMNTHLNLFFFVFLVHSNGDARLPQLLTF